MSRLTDVQAFPVKVVESETRENTGIAAVFHLLGQHPLDGFIVAGTVTLVEAAIGITLEGIAVEVHRFLFAMGGWDPNLDDLFPGDLENGDILIGQEVAADFLRVVEVIEQHPDDALRVAQAMQGKTVLLLFDPQYDDPAVGIGKGAVGRPEVGGEFPFAVFASGKFAFEINGFGEGCDVGA